MANIIELKFSETIKQNTAKFIYSGSIDNSDATYYIGTNLGSSSYTNLFNSGEVSTTKGDGSNLGQAHLAWNRNIGDDTNGVQGQEGVLFSFTNYIILPTYFHIRVDTFESTYNFTLQALDNDGSFRTIGAESGFYNNNVNINIPINSGWFSDTFKFRAGNTSALFLPSDIRLWGILKRKNGGSIGLRPIPTLFSQLADNSIDSNTNTTITYRESVKAAANTKYAVIRNNLTGNFQIGNLFKHTLLNLNPNGSNREVYLPKHPTLDTFLKITNTNGADSLIIKEEPGSPTITTLSNAENVLSAEFFWEASDNTWHVTQ